MSRSFRKPGNRLRTDVLEMLSGGCSDFVQHRVVVNLWMTRQVEDDMKRRSTHSGPERSANLPVCHPGNHDVQYFQP